MGSAPAPGPSREPAGSSSPPAGLDQAELKARLRRQLLAEAEVTQEAAVAARLRDQAERLTQPGRLSIGGEPPAWAAATPEQAERRRAARREHLERLWAGLADSKTPEQLGLRPVDEQIAERRLQRGTG